MTTSPNRNNFGKRIGVTLAVAAACASMSTSAMAGANADLLDLLLKKGVITQEEYQVYKDKAENQDFIVNRLNENDAKRPIVGIAKEGEPEPIVTLYGIADIGIAHAQHSLPVSGSFASSMKPDSQPAYKAGSYDGTRSATGMINGGMQDSRWGIRANLDIGEGRKAFTLLESGINLTTGQLNDAAGTMITGKNNVNGNSSLNGQLFGRQAYAGVSDPTMGSISFGRQYNFIYDVLTEYDPGLKSDLYSPLGLSGTVGGGGGISEDSRLDNSIKYKNKTGDINYGLIYKMGGTNSANPTSGTAVNLGYTQGKMGVQLTYGRFTDSQKFDGSAVKLYDTESWMVAGKYKLTEVMTIKGGIQYYTLSTPSDLAATFTSGLNYYGNSVSAANVKDGIASGKPSEKTMITFLGGDYDINSKTKVALAQYLIEPKSNVSSGGSQYSGTISWTTLIVDYRINKYFDAYGALAYVRFSGDQYDPSVNAGLTATSYKNSNSIIGAGLRMKF